MQTLRKEIFSIFESQTTHQHETSREHLIEIDELVFLCKYKLDLNTIKNGFHAFDMLDHGDNVSRRICCFQDLLDSPKGRCEFLQRSGNDSFHLIHFGSCSSDWFGSLKRRNFLASFVHSLHVNKTCSFLTGFSCLIICAILTTS